MRLGFDAKRLFFNRSGLGNYSRSTVELLMKHTSDNSYVLFTPREGNPCGFTLTDDCTVVVPQGVAGMLPSLWRSLNMGGDIMRHGVDIFHGLSNELPSDIRISGARSVVTMHDLIFVRYPQLYKPLDRAVYTRKYKRSCLDADRIVAISRQTRDDLVDFWGIDPGKIDVIYQGCNPLFAEKQSPEVLESVREKYSLPERYILSVGTIEERKNLLLTVKAMVAGRFDIDLVACGRRTPYSDSVMEYAAREGIADRVHFIHGANLDELRAIYRMAEVMTYVSIFEGFGIPILEAMNSHIPVITTRGGVFGETGGDACLYVDPGSVEEMTEALRRVLDDSELRQGMVDRGAIHAAAFGEEKIAANLMKVYESLL